MITSAKIPPEEGIGTYVYGLSKELIKKGHSVTIITRGSINKTEKLKYDSIDIIKIPFIPLYPFYLSIFGFFLNKFLNKSKNDFDILHIHSPLSPTPKTNSPIIATIHTPMLIDSGYIEIKSIDVIFRKLMSKYISYPLELNLVKRANIITVVSNSVKNELNVYYNVPNQKIVVIGNGINEKLFFPTLRRPNKNYLLYVGRLGYRKGLFDLIDSCAEIFKKTPELKLLIVGKGELESEIHRRVRELDLENRVIFLGFVNQDKLIHLYQNASLFILPSHYEGLPTVLLEAMSCGCPVVATSVSGNLDVIQNGYNGVLVPPKDAMKLSNAILSLMHNEQFREKLGENARKTIINKYTLDIISESYINNYQSIL